MDSTDIRMHARMNRVEELREAIAKGVNLDGKDAFGVTALHYAVAEKNRDVVALLLAHNADVCAQDKDGKTALHYAVEYNLPDVAEELLKKNPKVTAIADKSGNEPLWTATFNAKGDYDLVSLLLRYGANPHHRNNVNLTPLDIPKRKANVALLRILESAEPRPS